AVAHLGVAPQMLDDVEGVFDAGADTGARAVDGALRGGDPVRTPAAAVDAVADIDLAAQPAVLLAPVGAVAVDLGLLPVQQVGHLGEVVDAGAGGGELVGKPALVGADMHLHTEVPVGTLLRLSHLRVAFPIGVLRRAGRGDDGGVHDGARLQIQA